MGKCKDQLFIRAGYSTSLNTACSRKMYSLALIVVVGSRNGFCFKADFKALDCYTPQLAIVIGAQTFNAISVQFALHYAFSDEAKVDSTIKIIANSLSKNGLFFGTIPNSTFIVKSLRYLQVNAEFKGMQRALSLGIQCTRSGLNRKILFLFLDTRFITS